MPHEQILAVRNPLNFGVIWNSPAGIQGRFDFALNVLAAKPENIENVKMAIAAWETIFSDVQEQLGLRLESTKGSVENLIIDHAEKPSEN
jgi:uncharacterized protein (TIGR03435 family)